MQAIKALFLDLDGTLLDTADDFVWVMNQLLERENRAAITREDLIPHISTGARGMVCGIFDITPESPDYQERFDTMLAIYRAHLGKYSKLFPGIDTVLATAQKAGLKWGIITNKYARFAEPLLEKLQIHPDVLVCPDHVERAKPHPDAVLHACEHVSCQPQQSLFVGDHERDIASGNSAGSVTAVAKWGYFDPDEAHSWGADYVLNEVADLTKLVDKLSKA